MRDPKVLILDEPTRGVDVGAKEEIYHIIRRLTAGGAAILLISSEIEELLGLADRIVVLAPVGRWRSSTRANSIENASLPTRWGRWRRHD